MLGSPDAKSAAAKSTVSTKSAEITSREQPAVAMDYTTHIGVAASGVITMAESIPRRS